MSYIKKLVMHGFKSFPKKTEIPFTQGINVILGPNGSGKSNVSDAVCFVLGRLSIKSMRAAKAGNLIFMGSKVASASKEASVEITFDNSEKIFSLDTDEIVIKRIVRKNGQSIYKINNETKTRQDVLSLLAQAGIDPQGFNIILQGEIQNFVRMQPEERRGVIEEVSGISVYESRKEKSLKELEKTEDRLKEVGSILRERTAYMNNLEKERQQALKYKKLELYIHRLKASIINHDLLKKKKQADLVISEIGKKNKETENTKKEIFGVENEIKFIKEKIEAINNEIQQSTGVEQEALNSEIANLRADIAGLNVKLENQDSKLQSLSTKKQELKETINSLEETLKELKNEPITTEKKKKEIEKKKSQLESLEEQRKSFYSVKSELNSIKDRLQDKKSTLEDHESEANLLVKQIESISIGLLDKKSDSETINKLKTQLSEKRNSLSNILKKEIELEKTISVSESEIDHQKKLMEKISKLDICPICKNKITPEHMHEIRQEIYPQVESLKKQISQSDKSLKTIYQQKEILTNDIEEITEKISNAESDSIKLTSINEKKHQIRSLKEKSEKTKTEIDVLIKKQSALESRLKEFSNIEEKYETFNLELQEVSLRTKETVSSEVSFKERELDRLKISIKQFSREQADINEEFSKIKKIHSEKESMLVKKRQQEAHLSERFKKLISKRDSYHSNVRQNESRLLEIQHALQIIDQEINNLKIEKARIDAESENLESELSEFQPIEIIKANKEILTSKLVKAQESFSATGNVNLRSIEVYDSIKKEYDSIREKAELIVREKENILKVIKEIDIKKKKAFLSTLNQVNELFSRNFSQLSLKGDVYLELENKKDPFEHGSGVQIIVKTGHGKYFDVKSLSGGEQTLVALSLIFAIQEHRPYSFYLLDEIDAALDKRNSERLAGLLNKYMQKGQYVVVTHNDEIIQKATNLYGVSMHDGVSKIVSLHV